MHRLRLTRAQAFPSDVALAYSSVLKALPEGRAALDHMGGGLRRYP